MSHPELIEKLGGKEVALYSVARLMGMELPDPSSLKQSSKFSAPHRQDKNPSCCYWIGKSGELLLRDWSLGVTLDFVGFYGLVSGIRDRKQAWIDLVNRVEGRMIRVLPSMREFKKKVESKIQKPIHKPVNIHRGTRWDWKRLAKLRKLKVKGIYQAQEAGWLRFAEFHGQKAWLICDPLTQEPAQARLMSGELWWGEHKSLTITGAKTILGLDALHAGKYVAILEGGGDLLAFFSSGRHSSHSPICSLGSTHKPRSDLIEMFHYILMWNLVTIYQHNDEAGRQMTKIWTEALRDTFCVLQVITFNSKE